MKSYEVARGHLGVKKGHLEVKKFQTCPNTQDMDMIRFQILF